MPEVGEPAQEPDLSQDPRTGLSLGFLTALPLFVLYEWGLAAGGERVAHNGAELLVGSAFEPWSRTAELVRRLALIVLGVVAYVRLRRMGVDPARTGFARSMEGVLAAFLLGPFLLLWLGWVQGPTLEVAPVSSLPAATSLGRAARLVGGAAWEELVFRVGAYGILYLLGRRLLSFFDVPSAVASFAAELLGLLGSSLLFAAFHLEPFTRLLGSGGEAFDGSVFLWRLSAGMCLAGLFRWRGLGACSWAHAVFNLALVLGAGPETLRVGA